MSEGQRRVAVTRRVPLDHVADNWAGAYMVVQLLTYRERVDLSVQKEAVAAMSNTEATEFALKIAKKQFVNGMIPVFNDRVDAELVPMQADDIEVDEDVITAGYQAAMGVIPDPKVSLTMKEASSTQPDSSEPLPGESSTKTISSSEPDQPTAA